MKKIKNQSDMPDKKFEMSLFLIEELTRGDIVLTDSSYQVTNGQIPSILINRGFIITSGYFPLGAFNGYFGDVKHCKIRKVPAHLWESIWERPINVI